MTKLELGLSFSSDSEVPATQLLKRGFGEGVNGQLLVVLHETDGGDVSAVADETVDHIKTLSDVANPEQLTWIGNGPDQTKSQEGPRLP